MTYKTRHSETAINTREAVANSVYGHAATYPAVPALQKKDTEKNELQMKSATQLKSDERGEVRQRKEQEAVPPRANHTGMPDKLKTGIENLSGFSMDDVRVHYNSDKPAQLSALAYAQGTEIHVAPGQERHLPHEAWHVVQQKQGRVRPTMQMKGSAINDDKGLEREADVMGGEALQLKPIMGKSLTAQMGKAKITQFIARWYEMTSENEYKERWVGLPSFTGWQKALDQYNGKDVYINVGIMSAQKDETFKDWAKRNKWWLIALGITVAGIAAYSIYKAKGGSGSTESVGKSSMPNAPTSESLTLTSEPLTTTGGSLASTNSLQTPTSELLAPTSESLAPTSGLQTPTSESLAPTSDPLAPTNGLQTPTSDSLASTGGRHAWPLGKEYGAADKFKGMVSLFPGGGLVVESLEQIVKGKSDGAALVSEIIKLHPYAWPANVYDQVAVALSYYSEGKYELGQTKDLIASIFEAAAKLKS